jgi:outer membrane protein assembly factor BamB
LIASNRVYTFGAEGKLTCLALKDGAIVWQRDTAADFLVPEAFFGAGSSPLLEGGRLYVMVGGQPNSGMVALDPETGKTIWQSVGQACWDGVIAAGWRGERKYRWSGEEKLASYSSPIAATLQGQRMILCFMRQGLAAVNPTNGAVQSVKWFQSEANDSVNAMTPVILGNDILISAAYYRMGSALLHVEPDGKSFGEIWHQPANPLLRDPNGGFEEPILGMHWSQPLLVDGYLYGFTGRNEPDAWFRCVEWKTGKKMWERDERWAAHSAEQPSIMGRGSMIYADGKLIALGEGGILAMYKPNPAKCEELGRWQVPKLIHPCWAAPVLSDKRLYLRGEDQLLCLDMAAKK